MQSNSDSGDFSVKSSAQQGMRGLSKVAFYFLIAMPILAFALSVLGWLTFGVDIPYMDDWRPYTVGNAGSLALDAIFLPSNDTLAPVGRLLDALAQRWIHGNSIAYQTITMIAILGSLLVLQWRLLRQATSDKLLAAAAFAFTLPMLQPDTYWGLQNNAYHQALPLVCILAALWVTFNGKHSGKSIFVRTLIAGVIAGMTYISGAFAALTAGVALLIANFLDRNRSESRSIRAGGFGLLVSGILTVIPQIWVIAFFQKGTSREDAPMAYPY